jgi:hypothetical protein
MVKQLHTTLFNYLSNVGARFPQKDPEYNAEAEKLYKQTIVDKLLPGLEKQRKEMLSPDYKPNPDWWGSLVTKE